MSRDFIFPDSRLVREHETYYTARLGGRDLILCAYDPRQPAVARQHLQDAETTTQTGSFALALYPATYENVLAFDRHVAPRRKLVALTQEAGLRHGLGTGNRVIVTEDDGAGLADPSALGVFPGIFRAVAEAEAPNWFIQQSIVRELIPQEVDPAHHPGLGHTGGYGPRELLRSGLFAFISLGGYRRYRHPIGADADHAIVTGDDEASLAASMELNRIALGESRDYTKFTVDTSRLFGFPHELSAAEEARLRDVFLGRTWEVPNILPDRPGFTYTFDEAEVLRLGRKYWVACRVHKQLYDFIADLKAGEPFDYELSLDETPAPTPPREYLFYLVMLEEVMGLPRGGVVSSAPNFGFQKRADYAGDPRRDLWPLVNEAASIAAAFDQVVCFHSGSGLGVETGKGPGVDQVLAEATGGWLMLKVSGIYQEILWRVLAASPEPAEQALFVRAWEETHRVTRLLALVYEALIAGRSEAEAHALLADEGRIAQAARAWGDPDEAVRLVRQTLGYGLHQAVLAHRLLPAADPQRRRADDDFFRHFAYLVFRPLRADLYATMTAGGWERYAAAVQRYTAMRLRDLGLSRAGDRGA